MSFFHEINVTELRDGITSLHGIHAIFLKPTVQLSFSDLTALFGDQHTSHFMRPAGTLQKI